MSTAGRADTKLRKDKTKKKTDDIGKLSPTHSEIEEKLTFKAIDGEDIQSLAIKEEDLQKLKKSKPQSAESNRHKEVLVKKVDTTAYPKIEVKVAKLAPERPVKPIDVSDNLGIRFDKYGNCIPHSILGTVEEYLQEAVSNGKSIDLPYDTTDLDKPNADLYLKETNSDAEAKRLKLSLNGDGGENALNNWKGKMSERKNTQNIISKMVNRPIDGLVMNQSEKARQYNEIKTLLDRTLPLVEDGKGYRLGSEFWNQPLRIGNDETGLFTTLKKSEQGNLPPIEQISKPLSTLKESDFRATQPPVSHYPWHDSKYLKDRLKNLEPLINELVPHRPQFSRLELIGKNPLNQTEEEKQENDTPNKPDSNSDYIIVDDTWINQNIVNKENKDSLNNPYVIDEEQEPEILAVHPDVIQSPVFGPCIIFGGQTADWSGNDMENLGIVALESRLNFETKAGKRVLATFEIHNIGTTSIYYDWKKITEPNPFQMNNSKSQKFYFDTRSNVILPGDVLKLHIVFKSSIGGIFTEKWEFVTHPRLLGAASLILTLRGVAVQEDKFKKNRILIEKKLFAREAEIIAKSIVDMILSGVRTPERSRSPERAYITEEEIFAEKNPQFFYDHDTLKELKKLYLELFDESERQQHVDEWNLSINELKEMILSIDEPDDSNKQNLLFKLNYLLEKISFRAYVPNNSTMYTACYDILCSCVDEICFDLNNLRQNFNLPASLIDDTYPIVDENDRKYEEWKKEFELFKQVEQEKKNRLEKEKGKDTKGKKGGTAQGEKKDDKKKEEKKKTTPTPAVNSKSRISRLEMSRSGSQNQEKLDDRIKTPIVLSDRQVKNEILFREKAHIDVYQILVKTMDTIENMFHENYSKQDDIKLLENFIMQKQYTSLAPMNSDFID